MKKILFMGGSSLLAINWSYLIKDNYKVVLGLHNRWAGYNDVQSITLNFESNIKLKNQIKLINPDIIINTIALTDIDYCEKNFQESKNINCDLASVISIICKEIKIKYIHISTDHFFNSNTKYHKEDSKTFCVNNYAKTKLLGEQQVLKNNTNSLIIRTNFYCWGTYYRSSITDFIINNLKKNKKINLASNIFYTPIFVKTLVEQINLLIKKNAKGIYNIASKKRITKYEFGLKIAKK
ncbi:sugar nucleotide-binding protein, partial [Alphaproteobacteria bacterium]|nr:sugar nucleotide-binding protein [Alphaproteobacteria bacterium]